MGLVSLCKSVISVKRLKFEAEHVLDNEIADMCGFNPEYENWKKTYRLNTVAISGFLADQLCKLEGEKFDYEKRKIAYFGASAACISDDLIDKGIKDFKSFRLFSKKQSGNELFDMFNSNLMKLLPEGFAEKFRNIIGFYNYSQEQTSNLLKDIESSEVLKIKNNTGGFPLILLDRMMFPEKEDLPNDFHPNYDSIKKTLPLSKDEAIFNYGAMISRIDDLNDLEWDFAEGRKSLATEGLVTWKSLKEEFNYVRGGLRDFYPKKNVDNVMDIYSPLIIHLSSDIVNFRARMNLLRPKNNDIKQ